MRLQMSSIDSFDPEIAPIWLPESVNARLTISESAVHALAGMISAALAGGGDWASLGVAGGEKA